MQPPKSQVISNDDTLLRLSYHGQINQSLTSRRIGRISNRRNLSLDLSLRIWSRSVADIRSVQSQPRTVPGFNIERTPGPSSDFSIFQWSSCCLCVFIYIYIYIYANWPLDEYQDARLSFRFEVLCSRLAPHRYLTTFAMRSTSVKDGSERALLWKIDLMRRFS